MVERDKAAERANLLIHLGRLLAPLYTLSEASAILTVADYQVARARFRSDLNQWGRAAHDFVKAEGFEFGHELDEILASIKPLLTSLGELAADESTEHAVKQERLREFIQASQAKAVTAIGRVPLGWNATLSQAETPLAVCLKIQDAIATAARRLHFFDRYLDPDFFQLYLRNLGRGVEVRLVTTRGNANYGAMSVAALSRLAAQEFSDFQLIECAPSDLHDRNLRVDDHIFFLGPSIKDAGRYPTNFALGDSTAHGHAILDSILGKGKRVA